MSGNFSTIEEAVQAALDKQPLQYVNGRDYIDVQCTTLAGVLDLMHNLHWSNFRVKPELKVFKYSTRVFKCSAGYLTLWSSNQLTSQSVCEQSSFFIKWIGDAVEHTVEYEE